MWGGGAGPWLLFWHRVRNALGRVHKALFGEGPAHNALCHPGGPCAQHGVVSPRGGRCTTLCVIGDACAQRLVSPGGGLCTTPCGTAGAGRVPVA